MKEEKVSITGLLSILYRRRRTVLIIMLIFLVVGIVIYAVNPREYTSYAKLIPSNQGDNSTTQLSSLASLAGVDLGGAASNGEINSASFEEVLRSTPFLVRMVSNTYYFPSVGKEMSLKEYLNKHDKLTVFEYIGKLPGKLTAVFRSSPRKAGPTQNISRDDSTAPRNMQQVTFFANQVMTVDRPTKKAIGLLSEDINYSQDIKTGLINLSLSLQDRTVVAEALKDLIDEFSAYLSHYGRKLNRLSLKAMEPQLQSAEEGYKKALLSLATFEDRNRGVVFSAAKVQEQRLQQQLSLAQGVYTSLLRQKEKLQIQVSDSVAQLQIIEPPLAQTVPSRPRLLITVIIALFLGALIGATYVLSKNSVIQILGSTKKEVEEADERE